MLVIISGPSGVGKDTIIRHLKGRFPDPQRHFVVTYKTRERRQGEVDGVDYHFVTTDTFARLREQGAFLEVAQVHGHWSGTPIDAVRQALRSGRDAVLKIDVQGAQTVKRLIPDALLIFVAPPSMAVLAVRLRRRATETEAELEQRQRDAAIELGRQQDYDHVLVNETGAVPRIAERIVEILAHEHALRPDRRVIV